MERLAGDEEEGAVHGLELPPPPTPPKHVTVSYLIAPLAPNGELSDPQFCDQFEHFKCNTFHISTMLRHTLDSIEMP